APCRDGRETQPESGSWPAACRSRSSGCGVPLRLLLPRPTEQCPSSACSALATRLLSTRFSRATPTHPCFSGPTPARRGSPTEASRCRPRTSRRSRAGASRASRRTAGTAWCWCRRRRGAPELRGRGYARSVVAGSLLAARKQGIARAVLFADPANAAARRAYLSLGFRIVGDYGLVLLAP